MTHTIDYLNHLHIGSILSLTYNSLVSISHSKVPENPQYYMHINVYDIILVLDIMLSVFYLRLLKIFEK